MLEWWQALLIGGVPSVIGVVGTLVGAYFVHRWTRDGSIEAEVRQARRDERRKAVAPISQFLDTAAKADAIHTVKAHMRKLYDGNVADVQRIGTYESFEGVMLRDVETAPSRAAVTKEFYLACSAAPTKEWVWPLVVAWAWVGKTEAGSAESMRKAIQEVRKLVEDHIVEGTQ